MVKVEEAKVNSLLDWPTIINEKTAINEAIP